MYAHRVWEGIIVSFHPIVFQEPSVLSVPELREFERNLERWFPLVSVAPVELRATQSKGLIAYFTGDTKSAPGGLVIQNGGYLLDGRHINLQGPITSASKIVESSKLQDI